MDDNKKSCWSTMVYSFLTGAAIGAGLAILFTPVSGKEAREAIANQYEELKERLKKLESKLHKSTQSFMGSVDE